MYNIIITLISAVLFYIGVTNIEGGYLWIAALFISGIYLGHVVTEALNSDV
jgi:hypothetical protein